MKPQPPDTPPAPSAAPAKPEVAVDFAELHRRLDEVQTLLDRGQRLPSDKRREVLGARARALAGTRQEARDPTLGVLVFRVGGERYAVPVEAVDHVMEARGLCSLPGAPRHVLGALVSRARVVTVLDLRQLLGLEGGGMSDLSRVVVVDAAGEGFGIAVEAVEGRLELKRAELSDPPPGPFAYLTSDRLSVLDLERLGAPGTEGRP